MPCAPTLWTLVGRRTWLLPVVALACFPMLAPLLAAEILVAAVLLQAAQLPQIRSIGATRSFGVAIRGAWLTIATLGLGGLIGNIDTLT